MRPFSFGKKEKLKSRKAIEELFAKGRSVGVFPIRLSYQFHQAATKDEAIMQVGVTVSSRHFKKAVDRNRIKRLLRECYRLQKGDILSVLHQRHLKGNVFFIYVDKTMPDFETLYQAVAKSLQVLIKNLPNEISR